MRNFTILAVLVGSLFAYSASAALYVPDINGLYHFEDDSVDSSGNGYNGTDDGGITYEAGKFNNGWRSNGANKSVFDSALWDSSDDFTVGFWMKPKVEFETDDGPYILRKSNVGGNYIFFSYSVSCTADYIEYNHTGCKASGAKDFDADTWYYMVMRRSGTTAEIYINNVLAYSGSDSVTTNSSANVGLNEYDVGGEPDDFIVDELFFSNTAIPTSTLNSLYNSGSGNEICTTVGCDEATPSSTPSSTTNGTTSMTDFETTLSYYFLLLLVFFVAGGTFILVKPK